MAGVGCTHGREEKCIKILVEQPKKKEEATPKKQAVVEKQIKISLKRVGLIWFRGTKLVSCCEQGDELQMFIDARNFLIRN
jgi:hypothetical protein